MQEEYTFMDECLEKFGDKHGPKVMEKVNTVFDVLPLVAIIDHSIYCAHGGIPSLVNKVSDIENKVPTYLPEPDTNNQVASEILWNDPITNREYQDMVKNTQQGQQDSKFMKEGFLQNLKRNTGAYYSEDALKRFLKNNSLTNLIRAHEVIPQGFRYHLNGQCLTVFSCSKYCDENNDAAVAYVHDSKIRVITVDTNKPVNPK